ncbi:MAG: PD-(D/E)XK nuclease family protein [Alphaproteobacteria bacterium]|nr:PD-(D/E)XK nuclease family protein [Alphaproteobacteria bacterium]MDD9919596.1 PD-(D/E)XK nuclease family protein [Alphaproteobacteria bacterium]
MQTVAQKLLKTVKEPIELAETTIWVPAPRQGQVLAQLLQNAVGSSVILPKILPLQLKEEIPETLKTEEDQKGEASSTVRQMVLTRLLCKRDKNLQYQQAWDQAKQLASVLDELTSHGIEKEKLEELVSGSLAQHWQLNLDFLNIVLEAWPAWLDENNLIDSKQAQRHRLQKLANYYKIEGKSTTVWAVGFADTTPSGLAVLKAIAQMPNGYVVLPSYNGTERKDISTTHPQYQVQKLARQITDENIIVWEGKTTHKTNVTTVETQTLQREAAIIALIMREAWEEQKTCALVTPDRLIAERVKAELSRWKLIADDSAGQPLSESDWGKLLIQISQVAASRFNPIQLADLLSNFLVSEVIPPTSATIFTNTLLRGIQPEPGLSGLRKSWQKKVKKGEKRANLDLSDTILNAIAQSFQPLTQIQDASFKEYLETLLETATTLTQQPVPEEIETAITEWQEESEEAGKFNLQAASDALQALLAQEVTRAPAVTDRLFIWGPLESRLQQVDRVILAGLNEGTWPNQPSPDAWLNRAMREQLGLPDAERTIGLAAHDVSSLMHLPKVFLTRSKLVDGEETTGSRFIKRWEVEAGEAAVQQAKQQGLKWQSWAERLEEEGRASTLESVDGKPPLPLRPKRWSASAVGQLMSCPYQFFAEKVLILPEIESFLEIPEARERGQLVHTWLQAFFEQIEELPPPFTETVTEKNKQEALSKLQELAEAVCEDLAPAVKAIWFPRLMKLAPDLVNHFAQMAQQGEEVHKLEQKAEAELNGITFHARADRIDNSPQGVWIVDYKTGEPPQAKDVALGRKPQLAVEAWLQQKQKYVPNAVLAGVSVWHIPAGGTKPVTVSRYDDEALAQKVENWQAELIAGLEKLVSHYQNPEGTYAAVPGSACTYCVYAGVCRKAEWAAEGAG